MAFHQNFNTTTWTALFVFTGLCICFCVATLLYSVKIYSGDKQRVISGRVKLYSTLSIAFFMLAQIFSLLYTVYIKLPDGHLDRTTESLWSVYNRSAANPPLCAH